MSNSPIIKRNTNIGAADAESDARYLENCFIDTGDLAALTDCSNPKALVLGRTGAGKTALLRQLLRKHPGHSVELSPEALSLNFVTNSAAIQFFEEAGVQLDIFYTLLWRHIITVELLKLRYGIENELKQQSFLGSIVSTFSLDVGKARAIQYLQDWGSKFWQETEYRTKEFTRKLETDLSASAKFDVKYISAGAEGARRLTEEERMEVRTAGTRIVNEVQVRELHNVIRFLSEDVFVDNRTHYYVVIDRLDENWVDDRIKVKLIKSLLETVRTFHRVRNIKIIVALRADLHYRVIRETATPGSQEEKFRSLYLNITWSRQQLEKLIDDRVAYMFKWQYTKSDVRLSDIIADSQMEKRSAVEYMLDRTFFRPREAILYLNECLQLSEGRSKITAQIIRKAEGIYSQQRLASLYDEWRREYPNLELSVSLLGAGNINFAFSSIEPAVCETTATRLLENSAGRKDAISDLCEKFYLASGIDYTEFLKGIVLIFYQVGLVGLKLAPNAERLWSFVDPTLITAAQIRNDTSIGVHKTFWQALGLRRDKPEGS